jgi:molybdopterin-guanine dinucleotide biosynthesis protein A
MACVAIRDPIKVVQTPADSKRAYILMIVAESPVMRLEDEPRAVRGAMVGVVIAAGRSSRFGSEKAIAELRGKPLFLWAAERLQRSCALVAINARSGSETERLARAREFPVLHDAAGDAQGALAGVRAGLAWADRLGARALAVSPCDAPLLPDDLFERLIRAAGHGAAVADTADGRQPLCSVWPVAALPAVAAALAAGAHPPTWRVLDDLGAARVAFDAAAAFANINTRADLDEVAARLGYQR